MFENFGLFLLTYKNWCAFTLGYSQENATYYLCRLENFRHAEEVKNKIHLFLGASFNYLKLGMPVPFLAPCLNTYKIGQLEKGRILLGWVVFWMYLSRY